MSQSEVDTAKKSLFSYFKALPKAELHLHMEGAIRPEMLLKLAERNHLRLPFSCPDQWGDQCNFKSFDDFAKALLMGVGCLRQLEDFFDLIVDLGSALADQNIRYAEVTWTPQFYLNREYPLDALLRALEDGRSQVKSQFGIEMRWIPDLVRSYPGPSMAVANWASSPNSRSAGVVALGLGGPEAGHPAATFCAQFQHARSHGLPANPHAGEGMGPESVWETIQYLQPTRIGHGVRAAESDALVKYLADHEIPLEVCLTSNIKLGIFPSYAEHPLKKLFDAGCKVTINSDDPVLFKTTLTEEYVHAVSDCDLSIRDVQTTILESIRASYLPEAEKVSMQATFISEFSELDRRFAPFPLAP